MKLLGLCVLIGGCSAVLGNVITMIPCGEDEAAPESFNCTVKEVRVNPCEGAAQQLPCNFKRGENATINFDFVHDESNHASVLSSRAYWANGLIDLPLLGMDTDACHYTSCPLSSKEQTYTYILPISKKFPPRQYDVKWKLWDEEETMTCCFIFQIKILR